MANNYQEFITKITLKKNLGAQKYLAKITPILDKKETQDIDYQ